MCTVPVASATGTYERNFYVIRSKVSYMRCLRTMGAGLAVAVLAWWRCGAAWALEAPEIGRCVSHAGGKYTNDVCTKAAKGKKVGKFSMGSGCDKKEVCRRWWSGYAGNGQSEQGDV